MSTVFVVNKSCHDFTPARSFGKLYFISEGSIGKFNTAVMFRAAQRAVEKATAQDFILITGQSIMCSIVCGLFAKRFGRLNLLLYCGSENSYKLRRVVIDE